MKIDVRLVTKGGASLDLRAFARRALDATAEDVENLIEAGVAPHSKTGKLFASVTKQRTADGWLVGHDGQVAPHALFVHWGTRPHVIKPREKRALRWPGGRGFSFAKKVNHPGYRGDPWLVRAAAQAPLIFERHVDRLLAASTATQEA